MVHNLLSSEIIVVSGRSSGTFTCYDTNGSRYTHVFSSDTELCSEISACCKKRDNRWQTNIIKITRCGDNYLPLEKGGFGITKTGCHGPINMMKKIS